MGGELPLDPGTGRVALLLPGRDVGDQDVTLTNAAIQALTARHADLGPHYIQGCLTLTNSGK